MNMNNQMFINNQMNMNNPMNMNMNFVNQMQMNNNMNMNNLMMNINPMMNFNNPMNMDMMYFFQLFQLYNTMKNKKINNMNLQRSSNTQKIKSILPRIKQEKTHTFEPFYNGPRFNLDFQTPAGFKIMMTVPINAKIGKVLYEYISLVGLGPGVLEKGIYFLFNGKKIKKEDHNKTVQELGATSLSHIIVVDTENLIGA